jgi:hypothetical protein
MALNKDVLHIADLLDPHYTIYMLPAKVTLPMDHSNMVLDVSPSMLYRYWRMLFLVCALTALSLDSHLVFAAEDQPLGNASFVGTNQCFVCHRPQTDTWSETAHAEAFNHLPEKYRQDSACLACHVTGYGKANGYVAGSDKDLLMVGCEACHGPGDQHIAAAQRFILAEAGEEEKIEAQIRATIVKTPSDDVCVACHTTQAHGRHPPYEGQPPAKVEGGATAQHTSAVAGQNCLTPATVPASFPPGYSVKTCGGCHYDQYKQWRTEKHFALSAILTPQYLGHAKCQQCHPATGASATPSSATSDPHHNRIGVVCESCHGPALAHVRFSRQFISSPRLGPKLEEAARASITAGKPAAACIQCHVEQSHKEHPEISSK